MASPNEAGRSKNASSARRHMYRHPIIQRREGESAKRRQTFLKKVRTAGDDKKWQTRSDQILREDFLSHQKQWQEELARSAPTEPIAPEDDEHEAQCSAHEVNEVEIVDDVLLQEERGFEALISLMKEGEKPRERQQYDVSDYDSDEDYDCLFLEVLDRTDARIDMAGSSKDRPATHLEYEMDLSTG